MSFTCQLSWLDFQVDQPKLLRQWRLVKGCLFFNQRPIYTVQLQELIVCFFLQFANKRSFSISIFSCIWLGPTDSSWKPGRAWSERWDGLDGVALSYCMEICQVDAMWTEALLHACRNNHEALAIPMAWLQVGAMSHVGSSETAYWWAVWRPCAGGIMMHAEDFGKCFLILAHAKWSNVIIS